MKYQATKNFYVGNTFYATDDVVAIDDKELVKKLLDEGNIKEFNGADKAPTGFPVKEDAQKTEADQSKPPLEQNPTEAEIAKDIQNLENSPTSSNETPQIQ